MYGNGKMGIPALLIASIAVALCSASEATAQTRTAPTIANQIRNATVVPTAPVARGAFGRPLDKPFSNISRRPTVSPYLNLFRDGQGNAVLNYQTLVRPQLRQIERNRQQSQAIEGLNRQIQQIRSQQAFPVSGSTDIRATGHPTQFQNLSHYYSR